MNEKRHGHHGQIINAIYCCRWEPDTLHLRYPSTRVVMPEGQACKGKAHPDPLISESNCLDGERKFLNKMARRDVLEDEPDLAFLFSHFQMTAEEQLRILNLTKEAGGPYGIEETACHVLKTGDIIDWEKWVRIADRCVGHPEGWQWSAEDGECVRAPENLDLLYPVVIAVATVAALLFAVTGALLWRQRDLQHLVYSLESGDHVQSSLETYETPITQAVSLLKEVSHGKRFTREQQKKAVRTWQKLLSSSNLHAPDFDSTKSDRQKHLERRRRSSVESQEVAQRMVEFILNHSGAEASKAMQDPHLVDVGSLQDQPKRPRQLSECSMAELNAQFLKARKSLEELHSRAGKYTKSIGEDLMMDSFRLLEVTQRPLFAAVMIVMERHDLIRGLNLEYDRFKSFLLLVEEG